MAANRFQFIAANVKPHLAKSLAMDTKNFCRKIFPEFFFFISSENPGGL